MIKDIQKYIIETNLKQIKASLIEIKDSSIVVTNGKKTVEVEMGIDMPYIHCAWEQLNFIKKAFKKLEDVTFIFNSMEYVDIYWEDFEIENIEKGKQRSEDYEFIYGSNFGKIDVRVKTNLKSFGEFMGEPEYVRLLKKREKLKAKIKEELEKIDKKKKVCVTINRDNDIYVSESYYYKEIKLHYFNELCKDGLDEIKNIDEVVDYEKVAFFYTKTTNDEVKKAVRLIEEIVRTLK